MFWIFSLFPIRFNVALSVPLVYRELIFPLFSFPISVYCTNSGIIVIREQKNIEFYVQITVDQQFLFSISSFDHICDVYLIIMLKDRQFHILLGALHQKDFFHIVILPSSWWLLMSLSWYTVMCLDIFNCWTFIVAVFFYLWIMFYCASLCLWLLLFFWIISLG